MSLKVDKVQLEIIMKSDSARAEMMKLDDEARAIQKSMKGLKKDSEEYIRKNEELTKVKARMQELRNEIGLTGMTMRELKARAKELSMQMVNLDPRSEKYKEFRNELDRVNNRMRELKGNAAQTQSSFSKFTSGFNKFFAVGATVIATLTGIGFAIKKFTDMLDAREDSQANLEALTGLDKQSIKWLTEQSTLLSTTLTKDGVRIKQSSREILDAMTIVGSQRPELLKNKEALLAVTRDAMTMSIASKDSLEASTEALTNTLNQFNLEGTESTRIINAMAAGSKAGAATIPYLSQAIEKSGTTFALMGVDVETAIGVIESVAPKFKEASVAGNSLDKVLLKMKEGNIGYKSGVFDINDAIDELKTRFNKGESAAKIFGVEHAKMAEILIQSQDDINLFTTAVTGSNTALEQAAINSDTRSAKLAQAKNNFNEAAMALVENFTPAMTLAVETGIDFIHVIMEIPKWLKENKGLLLTLITTMAVYVAIVNKAKIANIALIATEKLKVFWSKTVTASTLLQIAATGYLTGSVRAANVAMKALFTTLKLNPYVALGVAVAGLTIGIYKLITAKKKQSESVKAQLNVEKKASEQYQKQAGDIDVLVAKIKNENISQKDRIAALNKLKTIIPEYNGMITEEGRLINNNTGAIDNYLVALEKQIKMKAAQEEWEVLIRQRRKQKQAADKAQQEADRYRTFSENTTYGAVTGGSATQGKLRVLETEAKKATNALNDTNSAIAELEKEINSNKTPYKPIVDAPKNGDQKEINGVLMEWNGKKWVKVKTPSSDLSDKELKELKKKYDAEFKVLTDNHDKRLAAITAEAKSEDELRLSLLAEDIKFYEEKLKIEQKYLQDTGGTEKNIADANLKLQKETDSQMLKGINDSYKSKQLATDQLETLEKQKLVDSYTTKKQMQLDSAALEITINEKRLQDAKEYADLIAQQTFASEQNKVDAVEKANQQIVNAEGNLVNSQKKHADVKYTQEEEFERKRQALIDKYGLEESQSNGSRYARDLKELKDSLDEKLITEEEYQKAAQKVKLDAVVGYANQAVEYTAMVSDAISEYHEMETSSLEAEKQKQLSIAGNDADKRAKVEKEFAQKELDLKKKQSGADAAIKGASALAAGALGVANIWAAHSANPILAAILTAMVGATVALQIANIAKQRQVIMNTTLDTSNSATGETTRSTGTRVAQAAEGRYDVIGADDNKTYKKVPYRGLARTMIVSRPTLMGERGDELIVDHRTLQNLRIKAPHVINTINRYRVPQRADGNYDNVTQYSASEYNAETAQLLKANLIATNQLIGLVADLKANGVKAPIVLSDLERKQELRKNSLLKGSLKK